MSPLRITYLVLATLGLVIPWYFNIQFMQEYGANLAEFIAQTKANNPATSFNYDLIIAYLAGSTWMVVEAKRLGMRAGWAYVALGLIVAFGCALPLFLFVRQGRLERAQN